LIISEVGSQDLNLASRVGCKFLCEIVHWFLGTGDQEQVVAAARQAIGVDRTDSRGCSGDGC
jgi:hypothetical protein